MTDLNRTIEYVFRISDNVSEKTDAMSSSIDRAGRELDSLNQKQDETRDKVERTNRDLADQQVGIVTQLTALMGFRESVSAVTGGIIGLGLVSDETAQDLAKVNAAFSIFAGAVTAIKSVQAVMTTLNTATAANAVINTYNAVISNPAMLAGVSIAAGAAAGIAGALLLSSSNTTNQTTINFQDSTPQQAVSEVFQVVGGGAL